ncbi:hypothetical protein C0Q70_17355 [Pomacea canaliculata]|uniref:Uncharacterized protein n=1 Tax=Pomacea canaliculata TaxID=400727 RepID=A0A2T7NK63_POMCA|nr:hypothetical protein C0Q70_17355 [Pomacea canaliculata]
MASFTHTPDTSVNALLTGGLNTASYCATAPHEGVMKTVATAIRGAHTIRQLLSKTERKAEKNLELSIEQRNRTNNPSFPVKNNGPVRRKKLKLLPMVPEREDDIPEISRQIIKVEENSDVDSTSSISCEQGNQQYMVVAMDDLLKPYTVIHPAGSSTNFPGPVSLQRKGNNTSVRKQLQTWTPTGDRQSAEFHCTIEVKQEASSDQEEGTEWTDQLEDGAVKKEALSRLQLLPIPALIIFFCGKGSLSGKRTLIPGSLPTEMMPSKYVVTLKPPPGKDWLSKTKEDEKSLKPSSNCKRTDKHLFLGKYKGQGKRKKLLLAPMVQQSESDFPKISLTIKRLEENPDTDAASSVPSEQAPVSNQQYMIVSMDDLLKPFSKTYPGLSQEPFSLHRNGNNTTASRQHQTWTTTCGQQPTDFHCTSEVKQEVTNDQEEGTKCTEQLVTCTVKKEPETELLSSHCCPHQGKSRSEDFIIVWGRSDAGDYPSLRRVSDGFCARLCNTMPSSS